MEPTSSDPTFPTYYVFWEICSRDVSYWNPPEELADYSDIRASIKSFSNFEVMLRKKLGFGVLSSKFLKLVVSHNITILTENIQIQCYSMAVRVTEYNEFPQRS